MKVSYSFLATCFIVIGGISAAVVVVVLISNGNFSNNDGQSSENSAITSTDISDELPDSKVYNCDISPDIYHDTKMIENCLIYFNDIVKNNTEILNMGQTEEDRDMKGIRFYGKRAINTNTNNQTETPQFINIGLFGNMHGNEISGRELLFWLMADLSFYFHQKNLSNSSKSSITKTKRTILKDQKQRFYEIAWGETTSKTNERYALYDTIFYTNNANIFIFPSINPDGFEQRYQYNFRDLGYDPSTWVLGRYNKFGFDLNRNYPDLNEMVYQNRDLVNNIAYVDNSRLFNDTYFQEYFEENYRVAELTDENKDHKPSWLNYESNSAVSQSYSEKELLSGKNFRLKIPTPNHSNSKDTPIKFITEETRNVLRFLSKNRFNHALNFHDGTKVISYPLDKNIFGVSKYTIAPDDNLIKSIAHSYADNHLNFKSRFKNPCIERSFDNGIVNGADWYTIGGSFQDYHYLRYGTIHMLAELNCDKFVDEKELKQVILDNQPAIIGYLDYVTAKTVNINGYSELVNNDANIGLEFRRKDSNPVESYYATLNSKAEFHKALKYEGEYEIYIDGQFWKTKFLKYGLQTIILN